MKTSEVDRARPVVIVWRSNWLAASETFIRNQILAMDSWAPIPVGLFHVESPISSADDIVHFSRRTGKLQALFFRLTGSNSTLRSVRKEFRPRVIHAHFASDGVEVLPFALRSRIPLVVTVHGIDITTWPNAMSVPGVLGKAMLSTKRRLLRRMLRKAAAIVAVSEPLAQRAIALGARADRVHVIHLGTAIDVPGSAANPMRERDGVLFVGRLVEKKGVDDLLQAVAALSTPFRQVPVTIVGDGPLRESLETQARALQLNVTFVGSCSPEEVHRRLSEASVFFSPSRTAKNGDTEGLPIALLEAAAHSLPVISTLHSGIPEAVEHGISGLLLEERDILGMAQALESLLGDKPRAAQMGRAGREKVRAEFDINRCTAELERLYDRVAKDQSQRCRPRRR